MRVCSAFISVKVERVSAGAGSNSERDGKFANGLQGWKTSSVGSVCSNLNLAHFTSNLQNPKQRVELHYEQNQSVPYVSHQPCASIIRWKQGRRELRYAINVKCVWDSED